MADPDIFSFINCSVDFSATIIIIFAFILVVAYNYTLFKAFKQMFLILLVSVYLYVTSNFLTWVSEYLHWPAYLYKTFIFLEASFASVVMVCLTYIILFYCNKNFKRNPAAYFVIGLFIIYMLMNIYNLFSGAFYYVTEDNRYLTGESYSLFFIPVILIILTNVVLLFRHRKIIDKNMLSVFIVFIIMASVSLVLELVMENYSFVAWGTAFSLMYMIFTMQIKQIKSLTVQSNEIERQKARIAVLEMRPHYIYNTMTSIYYLCGSDPEKAQKMTLYFTNYLRKNFNAVASEDLIPFSEEVEHTKAYLNVEKVRLGEKLTVNTDISHQNFKIPPLTLQPIVENAVKHGIKPGCDSLTVTVTTRELKTCHEIIVTDNGKELITGMNESTHSALTNIQIRLKNMCHGKLEITKDNTGNNAVRLVIPK